MQLRAVSGNSNNTFTAVCLNPTILSCRGASSFLRTERLSWEQFWVHVDSGSSLKPGTKNSEHKVDKIPLSDQGLCIRLPPSRQIHKGIHPWYRWWGTPDAVFCTPLHIEEPGQLGDVILIGCMFVKCCTTTFKIEWSKEIQCVQQTRVQLSFLVFQSDVFALDPLQGVLQNLWDLKP